MCVCPWRLCLSLYFPNAWMKIKSRETASQVLPADSLAHLSETQLHLSLNPRGRCARRCREAQQDRPSLGGRGHREKNSLSDGEKLKLAFWHKNEMAWGGGAWKKEVARDGTGRPFKRLQCVLSSLTGQHCPPQPHSAAQEVRDCGFHSRKPCVG